MQYIYIYIIYIDHKKIYIYDVERCIDKGQSKHG